MVEEKEVRVIKDMGYILLHPERIQIVLALEKKPKHVSALSRELNIERRLLTYHIQKLEEGGYLKLSYKISSSPATKGRTLRICMVTEKTKNQLAALHELLSKS